MITYEEYQVALKICQDYLSQVSTELTRVSKEVEPLKAISPEDDFLEVCEDVGIYNIMKFWNRGKFKVKELATLSIKDIRTWRGMGAKRVQKMILNS